MAVVNDQTLMAMGSDLIEPFNADHVQPASIDVHLDRYFQVAERAKYGRWMGAGVDNSDMFTEVEVSRAGYLVMQPNDFVLGSTFEKIKVPKNMVARFEGKSSLARLGLLVHITAGFIDPGFQGYVTVEIKNLMPAPWRLEPGMKIGQVCFEMMIDYAKFPYGHKVNGSHYQNAERGPTLSRSYQNFSKIDVFDQKKGN